MGLSPAWFLVSSQRISGEPGKNPKELYKLLFSGIIIKKQVIRVSPKYFRPAEVETLLGDASKAKERLGWKPKISFKQLVEDMCIYGQ